MRATSVVGVLVAALLAGGVAAAEAQTTRAFRDLGLDLNVGDRVRVTDRDGVRHDGTVRTLPPEALVISGSGGPRDFTVQTTAKVERRGDPVWTGALIGFIPGFVLGAQFVLGFSDHEEPLSTYVTAGGIVGLGGAGLGALIDSLHEGHRAVYVAEPAVALRVAPLAGRGRVGAFASLRW